MGQLNHESIAAASMWSQLEKLSWQARLDRGADNLIEQCIGARARDQLLIVAELDDTLYDSSLVEIIARRCRHLGVTPSVVREGLVTENESFPASLLQSIQAVDHVVFLNRIGDYLRFEGVAGKTSVTTCYAYSEALLASRFAGVSHGLMTRLRERLEAQLMAARDWRITCPLGTDVAGEFHWAGHDDDFLVGLFPVGTFKPVACHSATGTVCPSRWLMPGGAPKVDDPNLSFEGVVSCDVKDGSIRRIHGDQPAARHVSQYYDRVSATLGIERNRVHSWHVGIHPLTSFRMAPEADFERWCALSFNSPRYLHFHTCGDVPPGEVALSLFNCTVYIDGETFWQRGDFVWLHRPEIKALLEQYENGHWLLGRAGSIGVE